MAQLDYETRSWASDLALLDLYRRSVRSGSPLEEHWRTKFEQHKAMMTERYGASAMRGL
jgi:hypothetical protein